jgi:alpha-ketoglutarate-dependent taurine dioxygenase
MSDVSLEYLQPFGVILRNKTSKLLLSDISAKVIESLLHDNKVVILRGFPAIEKNLLVDYAKSFGSLLEWDFGNVMEMIAHDQPKNYLFTEGRVPLHWDGAFHREPRFLLFNCIVSPDKNNGGETFFSNTKLVLNDLSNEITSELSRYRIKYETEKIVHYGGSISVPIIQSHAYLNHKIMRFAEPVMQGLNPVSVNVEDVSQLESNNIISMLADKFYEEKYCYTHGWENNDFLIADNHSLLHGRNAFNKFSERHLRRIQIL